MHAHSPMLERGSQNNEDKFSWGNSEPTGKEIKENITVA